VLKDKVCFDNPHTEDDPVKRIPDVMSSVSSAELQRSKQQHVFSIRHACKLKETVVSTILKYYE